MKPLVAFFAFALVNAFGAVSPDLRNLPISFEPNHGQFSNDAQFGARAPGLQLSVSSRGVRLPEGQYGLGSDDLEKRQPLGLRRG